MILRLLAVSGLFFLATPHYVSAKESAVIACVTKLKTELGLSADLAYTECSKQSLIECINSVSGRNYVAVSIRQEGGGHLIDLGSNASRWLEGGAWQSHGCEPYIDGPKRITQSVSAWNYNKHQWFRQGVCTKEFVELEQPFGPEDAKLLCETNTVPKQVTDFPSTLK